MIAVAAAITCAVLFPFVGGSVSSLASFRMRYEAAVLVLFVVQAVLRGRLPGVDEASPWGLFAWGVTVLALIAALLPNRRETGVAVVILGLASNLWVALLNQGMPYMTADGSVVAGAGRFYHLATSATDMAWMGDVLPEPTGQWLLSIGDVLLFVGVVALVLHAASARTALDSGPG